MALYATGKSLGVTRENVHSRDGSFADFTSTTIHLLDGVTVTELRCGRDFDQAALNSVKDGDLLSVQVFMSKGRVYAERITEHVSAAAPTAKAS